MLSLERNVSLDMVFPDTAMMVVSTILVLGTQGMNLKEAMEVTEAMAVATAVVTMEAEEDTEAFLVNINIIVIIVGKYFVNYIISNYIMCSKVLNKNILWISR